MAKMVLNEQELREIVQENRYKVEPKTKFISRCVDGRYENDPDLPALAIPGADAGQLSLIFAAANIYGLEVDREKVYEALVEVVGDEKNLRMHTDSHAKGMMEGCGFIKQTDVDPEGFNLTKEDTDFIKEKFEKAKKKGAKEVVLEGEHREGAVVLVRGDWSLRTRHFFEMKEGRVLSQIFVFQQTLVNERHKQLAKKLLEKKAFKTLKENDADYLYMILSETAESHLFEIARRLAEDLPILEVEFNDVGEFDLKHLGEV